MSMAFDPDSPNYSDDALGYHNAEPPPRAELGDVAAESEVDQLREALQFAEACNHEFTEVNLALREALHHVWENFKTLQALMLNAIDTLQPDVAAALEHRVAERSGADPRGERREDHD